MPSVPFFQVDAFATTPLAGNPAAVMVCESFPQDDRMLKIAGENNLSETAFLVAVDDASRGACGDADYHLRWCTPVLEVPLCGHATLASALVVFLRLAPKTEEVRFWTKSGVLVVRREADLDARTCTLVLTGPAVAAEEGVAEPSALRALGISGFDAALVNEDLVVVVESATVVDNLAPDMRALTELDYEGVIVTAPANPGDTVDFVSRYFVPKCGIDEDPVTGYAHFLIAPYWGERLGKDRVRGRQVSSRPGEVQCDLLPPAVSQESDISTNAARMISLTAGATLVIEGTAHI